MPTVSKVLPAEQYKYLISRQLFSLLLLCVKHTHKICIVLTKCVINILFRWNPMKLVTYYLEEVIIKGMKHLCVFWKTFVGDLQPKKPVGNSVPRESGVLLSQQFCSAVPLLRAALKMCEIFDKSRQQMLICLPRPPRGLACVRNPAKNWHLLGFFQIAVFCAHGLRCFDYCWS